MGFQLEDKYGHINAAVGDEIKKIEDKIVFPIGWRKEEKGRDDVDRKMIEGGATYENLSGKDVLQLEPWQLEMVRREMRQDIGRQLAESPVLFAEDEYKKFDPEGLFRAWYEESKKESEPTFFAEVRPASGDRVHWGRKANELKEIDIKVARSIFNYTEKAALAAVYFENNREKAKQLIERAFAVLNNSFLLKPPSGLSADAGGADLSCTCSFAEGLGELANKLSFPDLADRFGDSTFCPSGNDRGYLRGESTEGVRSEGEDRPVEEIQAEIKKEVEFKANWWPGRKAPRSF